VSRVAARVQLGGHDVPEDTVRRRYRAGLRNLFALYMPLAHRWRVFDSSEPGEPELLATGAGPGARKIADPARWQKVVSGAHG
jgi:predicted ABC-type ATPase